MDTLVFDIETQNFFSDPGVGRDNFEALKISVVGVYSYNQNKYFCYEEKEMERLAELFAGSSRLIGFSLNRYDVPVLNVYFQRLRNDPQLDLWRKERVDLLQEVEQATGKRISLSRLAEANLGERKSRASAEAIQMFDEGRIEELKEYCLLDVRLTKQLYDLSRAQGFLLVPDRETGALRQVPTPHANQTKLL
ncbi:MAG: ribonuclease H-like domain-containing protein [Candidatus Liptonbacteria bacterium]|nr:ribonuclease H-like domain-containing protein [Candidatus Liptonbacteria bacterium]